jgi:hypothetical protein
MSATFPTKKVCIKPGVVHSRSVGGCQLTVTCQAHGQSSRIAPIAADLRFGAVRVKRRRSRRDAVGALDVYRAGPSLP